VSELKHVYYRGTIFRQAWAAAKWRARRQGCRPRPLLAEALREAWADAKRIAQKAAESRARVAACIAEIKAKNLIAGPARPLPPIARRSVFRPARRA
jgi:hypothetical protein